MSSKISRSRSASESGQVSKNKSDSALTLHPLRPYQREIVVAILDSIFGKKGLTFSVEIARQGGKNELSAQLEVLLLTLYMTEPWNIVKCSPTFKPQTIISMMRLKDRLNDAGFTRIWTTELGYIIRLLNARAIFLSADESANVVGNTAHLLLEIDESQDVNKEKYTRDFKPMGATTNVTTVHYGTTWDDSTLLEEIKQTNLELEKSDGIRRHFHYDWQEIAKYNPDYLTYVENERRRLGENHPLFLTQYCLQPLRGGTGFLSPQQKAQLQGIHPRKHSAERGKIYVAGIDIAGEVNTSDTFILGPVKPERDATVLTIAELDFTAVNDIQKQPIIKIAEHYAWIGIHHPDLYTRLIDILKNVWACKRIVIDATGMGQPVASFLQQALGSRVLPFVFTAPSKSKLGFDLLAAINSGRLKMYEGDGSAEFQEFWIEIDNARNQYRPNQTMNFFVDASRGHDDFLMSLALVVEAANNYQLREAKGQT
jgi:Terminase RNaseH-like domain